MTLLQRFDSGWQLRLRYLWITYDRDGLPYGYRLVVWLNIAGRKPLAHLPRWRRWLSHLPSVRWRLWPRPWAGIFVLGPYRR